MTGFWFYIGVTLAVLASLIPYALPVLDDWLDGGAGDGDGDT